MNCDHPTRPLEPDGIRFGVAYSSSPDAPSRALEAAISFSSFSAPAMLPLARKAASCTNRVVLRTSSRNSDECRQNEIQSHGRLIRNRNLAGERLPRDYETDTHA